MNVPAIFGFTKTQLFPIVNAIASGNVIDFTIRLDHRKKSPDGICGEYLLPTIIWKNEVGVSHECTLFVRRPLAAAEGRWVQAHHYHYLAKHGVPVPQLYGALEDNQGIEVLFLEYLDEAMVNNDVFFEDTVACKEFIDVIAKLNSIKPDIEYAAAIGRDMARREGYTRNWNTWLPWSVHVLGLIEKYADTDLLGDKLKRLCRSRQAEIKSLKRISLNLMRIVPNMPVGLVHGDLHPGNTGLRKKTKQLVIFDFDDIMFDARFYDVARILGGRDKNKEQAARQRDLAAVYLDTYSLNGGDAVSLGDFLKETTLLWYARKLNLWEFLPEDLNGPPYRSASNGNTRQTRLDLLYDTISVLMNKSTQIGRLL